jgi:hypothetical protein
MDSILDVPQIESNVETTDTFSEGWGERKKEKFYKKHRELMDQRLRSRKQKTRRLQETTSAEYNEPFVKDDVVEHWDKINDPNVDVKSEVVQLFKEEKDGGRVVNKKRKTKKRTLRKRKTNKKRKSNRRKSMRKKM